MVNPMMMNPMMMGGEPNDEPNDDGGESDDEPDDDEPYDDINRPIHLVAFQAAAAAEDVLVIADIAEGVGVKSDCRLDQRDVMMRAQF